MEENKVLGSTKTFVEQSPVTRRNEKVQISYRNVTSTHEGQFNVNDLISTEWEEKMDRGNSEKRRGISGRSKGASNKKHMEGTKIEEKSSGPQYSEGKVLLFIGYGFQRQKI